MTFLDAEEAEASSEIPADEWRRRLTVKGEPLGAAGAIDKKEEGKKRKKRKKEGEDGEEKRRKKERAPKAERLISPQGAPIYTPALASSQLPFGSSQLLQTAEEGSFSSEQLQLLGLSAERSTGLWRLHARSGVRYRKGPFTPEERLLVEEALEQYAQREGLSSVEEAIKSLSGNVGRKSSGRFQFIARCLPHRPFVSVYGYVRRRLSSNTKRGPWTEEEKQQLLQLAKTIPSSARGRWVKIAAVLGRRPGDVCDKWRGLQPRLKQIEEEEGKAAAAAVAGVPALEDARGEGELRGEVVNEHTHLPPPPPTAAAAAAGEGEGGGEGGGGGKVCLLPAPHVEAAQFSEDKRRQLLQEVQQRTGEELPSFGIPWQRIQEEVFPRFEHALLRRVYLLVLFPAELEKRMRVNPRPVILRHILRCLQRLKTPLPAQLRGIEWFDILPFVPGCLQREILRAAAGSLAREKGATLEAAVPVLLRQHRESLELCRKKDAFKLLLALLPVSVQQRLEAKVVAKGAGRNWKEEEVKKKLKKRIRKAAADELNRLKDRLAALQDNPLNAPPRGKTPRAALLPPPPAAAAAAAGEAASPAAAAAEEEEGEMARLLAASFTVGLSAVERLGNEERHTTDLLPAAHTPHQAKRNIKAESSPDIPAAAAGGGEGGGGGGGHGGGGPWLHAEEERRTHAAAAAAAAAGEGAAAASTSCSMVLRSVFRGSRRRADGGQKRKRARGICSLLSFFISMSLPLFFFFLSTACIKALLVGGHLLLLLPLETESG
ncbi:hypothetical protein Efla_005112 [Eimeria flavescens]